MPPTSSFAPELPISALLDDSVSFPFSVTGGLRRRLERHQALYGAPAEIQHFDYQDLRGSSPASRVRTVRPTVVLPKPHPGVITPAPPTGSFLVPNVQDMVAPQSLESMALPEITAAPTPRPVVPPKVTTPPAAQPLAASPIAPVPAPPVAPPTVPQSLMPLGLPDSVVALPPQTIAPVQKRPTAPVEPSVQPLLSMPAPSAPKTPTPEDVPPQGQEPGYQVADPTSFHISDRNQRRSWNIIDPTTKLPAATELTGTTAAESIATGWGVRDQAPKQFADWTTVKQAPTKLAATIDVNLEGHRADSVSKAEAHAMENLKTTSLRAVLMNAAICAVLITAIFGILTAINHH